MIKMIGKMGNGQIFKHIARSPLSFRQKIRLALLEAGQEHVEYIRDLMAERKTGRVYIIKGVEHQASAPGEAPAIRSRELIRSLFYSVSGHYYMKFGATADHAEFLEDGTSKMDPRPFAIRAALDKERDTYNSILKHGSTAIRL